jgi:hypothetical protein
MPPRASKSRSELIISDNINDDCQVVRNRHVSHEAAWVRDARFECKFLNRGISDRHRTR